MPRNTCSTSCSRAGEQVDGGAAALSWAESKRRAAAGWQGIDASTLHQA